MKRIILLIDRILKSDPLLSMGDFLNFLWIHLPWSESYRIDKAIKKQAKENEERIKRGEEPLRLRID